VKSHVKTIYKKILKVQNRQTGPSWLQQAPGHSQFHSSQELQICICSALPHLSYGFICDISKLVSLSQVFRTVFRWRTRVIQLTLRLASWLVCSYCRHSISLGWSLAMLAIPCDTRVARPWSRSKGWAWFKWFFGEFEGQIKCFAQQRVLPIWKWSISMGKDLGYQARKHERWTTCRFV
jgi:hypothetical protein